MSPEEKKLLENRLSRELQHNNISVVNTSLGDRQVKEVKLGSFRPGIKVWGKIDGLVNYCGFKIK